MNYNIDLSAISVWDYKELLKRQNLLPGRRILLQDIDYNFEVIGEQNIKNIAQLKKQISTPSKIASFELTGISKDYLTILKREIGALEQKPVPIADFPNIDEALVVSLKEKGVKTSKDYFESGLADNDEMLCLCDLVRINGVGAVAAKAFYEAGYCSVEDVSSANAAVMLEKVSEVNNKKHYYKAKLGEKDMQFCIDFALMLIKYST